jgi:hypothetical protein
MKLGFMIGRNYIVLVRDSGQKRQHLIRKDRFYVPVTKLIVKGGKKKLSIINDFIAWITLI